MVIGEADVYPQLQRQHFRVKKGKETNLLQFNIRRVPRVALPRNSLFAFPVPSICGVPV